MSQSVRDLEKSILADNAIAQYLVVKVTSTGCDVATANTDKMIGVSQNTAAATEQSVVRFLGTTKATASGAISVGDSVTATTAGKIASDSTDKHGVIGIALEAAVNSGDIIEVMLTPGRYLSV